MKAISNNMKKSYISLIYSLITMFICVRVYVCVCVCVCVRINRKQDLYDEPDCTQEYWPTPLRSTSSHPRKR